MVSVSEKEVFFFRVSVRSANTKGHVAGTWSENFYLAATVCDISVFANFFFFFCGRKILSARHVAWNAAGLNSCAIKQGQDDPSFYCLAFTALANCPSNLHPCVQTKQPHSRSLSSGFPPWENLGTGLLTKRLVPTSRPCVPACWVYKRFKEWITPGMIGQLRFL